MAITSLAKDIVEKFNSQVPDNFDGLVSLSGVGRKTANVVLSVGFKKPAIAVDTHVFRLSNRLGLTKANNVLDCEKDLMKNVEKHKWSQFHHYLVLFGRYVCSSQSPKCKDCELKEFCNYNKSSFSSSFVFTAREFFCVHYFAVSRSRSNLTLRKYSSISMEISTKFRM